MIKKLIPLFLISLLLCQPLYSQLTESEEELVAPTFSNTYDRNFFVELNLRGLGSTQERHPFWLYHNQRGRISDDTNISSWVTGKAVTFLTPESYLLYGAGILYNDGDPKTPVVDELFAHFQNSWMYATIGRKQRPEVYNGISSSNESILRSLNARPMPGIQIGTTEPLFLFSEEGLGVEASWEEYWMGNDRYIEGTKLHHKYFRVVYRSGDWEVKAGLQHYAQWAGHSPRMGPQPDSFVDYLKIITAQSGGEDATIGDQMLALGNQLGGWEFYITKEFREFSLEFFYNHLFEDRSGMILGNTPDGRYGIFLEAKDKERLVHSLMYELQYTQHQSHTTTGVHKYDNYFNNGTYLSGWTYEGRTVGSPFFTATPDRYVIINNKFNAHHLGIAGQLGDYFRSYPYKLLLSYARNDGRYVSRFRPEQDVFYGLFDVLLLQRTIDINLQLGIEFNTYSAPVYGAGVHLVYGL